MIFVVTVRDLVGLIILAGFVIFILALLAADVISNWRQHRKDARRRRDAKEDRS